jgi:transposase
MRPPIYVKELNEEESLKLKEGLRSSDAFVLRRCQIILASASGLNSLEIAPKLGCASQTVRNVIKAFNQKGLGALVEESNRPKTTQPVLKEADLDQLKGLLHQSPRNFGKERSQWTLDLLAQVSFESGLTPQRLSDETIRMALKRLGVKWKRAKHWISSPDPEYNLKKSAETG